MKIIKKLKISLVLILLVSYGYSQDKNKSITNLKVIETKPNGLHLGYYPKNKMKAQVNPPGFTWTKHSKASSYSFTLFKGKDAIEIFMQQEHLKVTVAVLEKELDSGDYSWLIIYNDSIGNVLGRSRLRTFTVDKGLPSLVMPNIKILKEELMKVSPRIFLTPNVLKNLQQKVANKSNLPFWDVCRSLADSALVRHLPQEPKPYKDSVFEVSEWRRIYKPVKTGTANMVRMALIWKVTNEQKYLDGAKKRLVNFASWDPDGITSFRIPQASGFMGNTEASMPLLERMAMVYDWVHDELSTDEKKKVLSSLKNRGNQMLKRYTDANFISEPWDNHTVRSLAFTGLAGLATLGDLPDAEKWLDYVLKCYLTSFPTWGGDDGGWSQGLSYSSTYNLYQTNFVEALNLSSNINLYNKPFFRNNGYFGLYCLPPYAVRGGFGDDGENSHSPKDKLLSQRYAIALNDSMLMWQAENIHPNKMNPNAPLLSKDHLQKGFYMEDVVSILTPTNKNLKPVNPGILPQSKLFSDIGWVAMHSDLGNANNDVWMLFKSSPYGSFSHSHADQNSFQINAFGEALLIDSGYYPWYGDPHHFLWTRQTKAHNAILIDGRGQHVKSKEAIGTIEKYEYGNELTIVTGECASGYNLPADDKLIELWKANLDEPLPTLDNKAKEIRRTIVFRHDKDKPWILIQDYMKAEKPATFDYMLHALEKIKIDKENQQLTIEKGNAVIDVYIISSDNLKITQTDKFNIDPGERDAGAPNQWHVSASNLEKQKEIHFLTLMIPRRKGEKRQKVKKLKYENSYGFEFNGQKILGWSGKGEKGSLSNEMLDAKLVIEGVGKKENKTVLD